MDDYAASQLPDFSFALAQARAERLRRTVGANAIPAPKTTPKEQWPPDYDAVRVWRQDTLQRFELNPDLVASAKAWYADHPVDFINHWCDTYDPRNQSKGLPTRFPLILFPRQEELIHFTLACIRGQGSGQVEKSRDMGASWVELALTVHLWLFWAGAAIGWGSNDKDQVDVIGDPKSLFEKLRMLIRGLPRVFLPANFDDSKQLFYCRCINPENGATISGDIGDNIGRGARSLVYFVDEAGFLKRPEMAEASLSETTRTRIDISTVTGLGSVFYRKREAGEEWNAETKVIHRSKSNVFVMDWSDHPEKSRAWHDERKTYFEGMGLAHVFARETDRDYAAAVEGIIIKREWVQAAIDADTVLGFDDSGKNISALDVADEGQDRNALARRKGRVLKQLEEWTARDTAQTAMRAVTSTTPFLPGELQYDSIGVGAGVKAETNRLRDAQLLPPLAQYQIVPWGASSSPLDAKRHLSLTSTGAEDVNSPKNEDFFANLKAQAWWMVARMFELTWRCVTDRALYQSLVERASPLLQKLISIPSTLPLLRKLEKELSQAVMTFTATKKLVVDKSPSGTSSPNLADAVVMAYWPARGLAVPTVSIRGPMILSG